jgi:hypothetical protein
MFGYDRDELLTFAKQNIGCYTVEEIQGQYTQNDIGQGISRTTFYFDEYPDIVFKIAIGCDDDCAEYTFEEEETVYYEAMEHGLEKYFAELEYIGDIKLSYEYEDWADEESDETVWKTETRDYNIYIQPKADFTVSHFFGHHCEEHSFKKETRIVESSGGSVALDTEASALFIRRHGIEEFTRLSNFFEKVRYLDDLHNSNWALLDGNMVIIDYAM